MTTYHVGLALASTPYCCGVWELGSFYQHVDTPPNYDWRSTSKESYEAAWQNLLAQIRDYSKPEDYIKERIVSYFTKPQKSRRLFLFNFYSPISHVANAMNKGENTVPFQCQPLLNVVKNQLDYVFLNEFINANTGNLIHSCMLTNDL
jgi:hypothetical protein